MKISRVRKSAATLIEMESDNQTVLVSYSTPVAAVIYDHSERRGMYVIDSFYSVTTTRHIGEFLRQHGLKNSDIEKKPESFFQELLEGGR